MASSSINLPENLKKVKKNGGLAARFQEAPEERPREKKCKGGRSEKEVVKIRGARWVCQGGGNNRKRRGQRDRFKVPRSWGGSLGGKSEEKRRGRREGRPGPSVYTR